MPDYRLRRDDNQLMHANGALSRKWDTKDLIRPVSNTAEGLYRLRKPFINTPVPIRSGT